MIQCWNEFEWTEDAIGEFLTRETLTLGYCFVLDKQSFMISEFYHVEYPFDPDANCEFDFWYEHFYEKCPDRHIPDQILDVDDRTLIPNTGKEEFCLRKNPCDAACQQGECPREENDEKTI